MPIKGVVEAKSKTSELVGRIQGELTERTVTEICIIGQGYATVRTPVDTSLLINSQYRVVTKDSTGAHGRVGYTAEYAAAVHAAKGTTKDKDIWRDPWDHSRGYFWDPKGDPGGSPQFLKMAFEVDAGKDIRAAILRGMAV